MSTKKQGFASLNTEKLQEVSARGGSREVPKGFATLPPKERELNAARAARIRWDKVKAKRRAQEEQRPEVTED